METCIDLVFVGYQNYKLNENVRYFMWYFKNGIMKEFDTNARAGVKINIYLNGRYI